MTTKFCPKTTVVTSPTSFTKAPLTPPASEDSIEKSPVSVLLEEIRRRSRGRGVSEPWMPFELDPNGYKTLQQKLQKDSSLWGFVQDKLRYHYFPSCNLLVLRMPKLIHEKLIRFIARDIANQLESIAQGQGTSARFARNIDDIGSTTIEFEEPIYGEHQPDIAFKHVDELYPGVVLEISYSQKRKNLSRLADDYILGSDQDIRLVIGVDIEYKGTKQATVSIWRPQITQNEVGEYELHSIQSIIDQEFRNAEGDLVENPQADIAIPLIDFTSKTETATFDRLEETICISSKNLYAFLERAEAIVSRADRTLEIKRTERASSLEALDKKAVQRQYITRANQLRP